MGQWYSVIIKGVAIRKGCNFEEMLKAVKKVVDSYRIEEECKDKILKTTNVKELVESVFGSFDNDGSVYGEWETGQNENTWDASFHGSYGWERIMSDCFIAMAPHLETGCKILVSPDEEDWGYIVQTDGSVKETIK